ncbi:hypothetical protein ABH941_004612 [Streptacidiphilus sp. EB103A]
MGAARGREPRGAGLRQWTAPMAPLPARTNQKPETASEFTGFGEREASAASGNREPEIGNWDTKTVNRKPSTLETSRWGNVQESQPREPDHWAGQHPPPPRTRSRHPRITADRHGPTSGARRFPATTTPTTGLRRGMAQRRAVRKAARVALSPPRARGPETARRDDNHQTCSPSRRRQPPLRCQAHPARGTATAEEQAGLGLPTGTEKQPHARTRPLPCPRPPEPLPPWRPGHSPTRPMPRESRLPHHLPPADLQ